MRLLSEKNENGIFIVIKSLTTIIKLKIPLLFILSALTLNGTIFLGILNYEYTTYGIHIYDYTSLGELLHPRFDFWDHIGHVLLLLAALFVANFLTTLLKFFYLYYLGKTEEKKKITLKDLAYLPIIHFFPFLRIVAIRTVENIHNVLFFSRTQNQIKRTRSYLEGEVVEQPYAYLEPPEILVYPIIIHEKKSLARSINCSKHLLINNFGENATFGFEFTFLYIGIATLFAIISFFLFHFIFDHHIFTTLILFLISWRIVALILQFAILTFESSAYLYCKGRTTAPFTKQEIKKLFTKKPREFIC